MVHDLDPFCIVQHSNIDTACFISHKSFSSTDTYSRAGQLFPGPHLFVAGILVTALSFSVALVPHLKDSKRARTLHALTGMFALALIAWQVLSGIPILLSVLESVR